MAYCDKCGNFDKSHVEDWDLKLHSNELSYQPDLYYYWDSPIEEDYDWRDAYPDRVTDDEYIFIYDKDLTPTEITLNVEWRD